MIITAQLSDGADGFFLSGREPGTTTEYGGIFPYVISPVDLFTIFVDYVISIPMLNTEPSPTITPSTTSDIAPKNTLSSIIVGNA